MPDFYPQSRISRNGSGNNSRGAYVGLHENSAEYVRLSGEPVTVPHLSGGEIAADVRTGTPQGTGGETVRHGRGRPSGGRSRQTVRRERLPIVRQTVRRHRARAQAASRPAADRANLSPFRTCHRPAVDCGEIATDGAQERHRRRGEIGTGANPSGTGGRNGGRLPPCFRRLSGAPVRRDRGETIRTADRPARTVAADRERGETANPCGRPSGRSDASRNAGTA